MLLSVVRIEDNRLRNKRMVVRDKRSGVRYVVMTCHDKRTTRSMVTEEDACPPETWTFSWALTPEGYARSSQFGSFHRFVLGLDSYDPDNDEDTVDHINRVRCDNRLPNLRTCSRSEQSYNRNMRGDRGTYDGWCREFGIPHFPRSIRWDDNEKKFTFKDHPLYDIARAHGIRVDPSGTKSEKVSLLNKFRSCLVSALDMFRALEERGIDVSDPLDDTRVVLAREYNALVRFAHEQAPVHFPDGPYADESKLRDSYQRDPSYFRSFLDMLPPPQESEVLGGPKTLPTRCVPCPELNAFVCARGDGNNPYVWDARHHEFLENLSIDKQDGRVFLTPELRATLGLDPQEWRDNRIHLSDLVYHCLEGHPKLDNKHVVVPYNQVRKDVRAENLVYVRGEGKNFKAPPSCIEPLSRSNIEVGMPFLPRGVTVFFAERDKRMQHPRRFEFHVRPGRSYLRLDGSPVPSAAESRPSKPVAYCDGRARSVFEKSVIPLLRGADPAFDHKNAKYQRLLTEYHDMWRRLELDRAASSVQAGLNATDENV